MSTSPEAEAKAAQKFAEDFSSELHAIRINVVPMKGSLIHGKEVTEQLTKQVKLLELLVLPIYEEDEWKRTIKKIPPLQRVRESGSSVSFATKRLIKTELEGILVKIEQVATDNGDESIFKKAQSIRKQVGLEEKKDEALSRKEEVDRLKMKS